MPISLVDELVGRDFYRVDVEATDDAQGTIFIPHNMNTIDVLFAITPTNHAYYLSNWIMAGLTLNSILLFKDAVAGSGVVGSQLRVAVFRPHSIIS